MTTPTPAFQFAGRRRGWLAWLAGGLLCLPLHAQVTKEYQVKAAFLYNFTKFVEWPASRFKDTSSPIVIGLFGQNQFGDELAKIVAGRKANGREIEVREIGSAADATSVQIVFIGAGGEQSLGETLATLDAAGVLTVGESPQFIAAGGMINFVVEADKIRFEINLGASERAGLKISAQLLKLATAVHKKSSPLP
jgi:hypothetical protein